MFSCFESASLEGVSGQAGGPVPEALDEAAVVDATMRQLLSVRHAPPGMSVEVPQQNLLVVARLAAAVFLRQPMLLELSAPMNVMGDTHGQYSDLLRMFEIGGYPPQRNYLFLGDYVDRGRQGIETLALLLCFKIKYPDNFFLLRGNHECALVSKLYGFYDECKRRYSVKLWKVFGHTFNCMPVAAVIENKIFCCHGGLSPKLQDLNTIIEMQRPLEVPEIGLLTDLLWADPEPHDEEWKANKR